MGIAVILNTCTDKVSKDSSQEKIPAQLAACHSVSFMSFWLEKKNTKTKTAV